MRIVISRHWEYTFERIYFGASCEDNSWRLVDDSFSSTEVLHDSTLAK